MVPKPDAGWKSELVSVGGLAPKSEPAWEPEQEDEEPEAEKVEERE